MTITLRKGYQGPTDHSGGNSAANSWAVAQSSGQAMAAEATAGDCISYDDAESCGECAWDEFRKALKARGLTLVDEGNGHEVVAAE